jgi:putative ABC transport system permease protein
MNLKELLRLSVGALRANKMRSLLTMLGVIIGVFAVILLVSLGSGLQAYISSQISGLGSNLIFVVPGQASGARAGGSQTNKLIMEDATNLTNGLQGIADVGPIVQQVATLKNKGRSDKGATVIGTTSNYPQIIVSTTLDQGSFFNVSQQRLGSRVAVIGQTVVTSLFPDEDPIGQQITVAGNNYTVIGTLQSRGSVFGIDEDNTIVVPIAAAQRQFGIANINALYLSARSSALVRIVKARANTILLKRLTSDDFTIETQEQTLSTVTNIISSLTAALGGIAAISLIVGGIGVMNIMLVSVTERTREIGLRKALGARRSDILKQFLFEAVILSVTGGIIGILLGLGASYILAKFFISQVTPWSVILAFGFSAAVGIIFGIAPAYRASRLSPIEALRYE